MRANPLTGKSRATGPSPRSNAGKVSLDSDVYMGVKAASAPSRKIGRAMPVSRAEVVVWLLLNNQMKGTSS
jgi:hypothetical protein